MPQPSSLDLGKYEMVLSDNDVRVAIREEGMRCELALARSPRPFQGRGGEG